MRAGDIPVAHTPPGGYGETMPPPVLGGCDEPLVAGAPDLRGMWAVVGPAVEGEPVPDGVLGLVQRIEQCGDRLVVTAGGVVHDMRCDGVLEHGVDDVAEIDLATRIRVAASYEDGVHVLRPDGIPVEVRRWRDGADMIWQYVGFTVRAERVDPSGDPEEDHHVREQR